MISKIIDWQSENWKQRLQTTIVFLKAALRMCVKGKVEIKVDFKNL